jgi:uncharacterized caspase-like protein
VDLALVYFSGHAFDDEYGNGFLAPYDMDYERPLVKGVRMQELNDLMRKAVNKDVVLIMLDACKSGIAASGDKGSAAALTSYDEVFNLDEAEEQMQGRGRVLLASSGPDEKSRERLDCRHQFIGGDAHAHGAFTYYVLEGLSGRAATKTSDVTLSTLHSFVADELRDQTVTFFGSGVQNASRIHLVTATQFASISEMLDQADAQLQSRSVASPFLAVRALAEIQPQVGSNERAQAIRTAIDDRLTNQSQKVSYYMAERKLDLVRYCPGTCRELEDLVSDISFDALSRVSEAMMGLLIGLWEASEDPGDQRRYKTLLNQMVGVEKHAAEPDRVAKPPDQRLKASG